VLESDREADRARGIRQAELREVTTVNTNRTTADIGVVDLADAHADGAERARVAASEGQLGGHLPPAPGVVHLHRGGLRGEVVVVVEIAIERDAGANFTHGRVGRAGHVEAATGLDVQFAAAVATSADTIIGEHVIGKSGTDAAGPLDDRRGRHAGGLQDGHRRCGRGLAHVVTDFEARNNDARSLRHRHQRVAGGNRRRLGGGDVRLKGFDLGLQARQFVGAGAHRHSRENGRTEKSKLHNSHLVSPKFFLELSLFPIRQENLFMLALESHPMGVSLTGYGSNSVSGLVSRFRFVVASVQQARNHGSGGSGKS